MFFEKVYLKVQRVPMSSIDSSSALDLGKERRYLNVSKAGTTRAFLVLAMSSWTILLLQGKVKKNKNKDVIQKCIHYINRLFLTVLPEVFVEAVHGQKIYISQKNVGCVDIVERHIAYQIDRVELTLLINDMIAHILAVFEDFRGLSVAQELLGLGIRHVEGQTNGALPVFTDRLQHLQSVDKYKVCLVKFWAVIEVKQDYGPFVIHFLNLQGKLSVLLAQYILIFSTSNISS